MRYYYFEKERIKASIKKIAEIPNSHCRVIMLKKTEEGQGFLLLPQCPFEDIPEKQLEDQKYTGS